MEKMEILKNNGVDVDSALEFWGDIESYQDSLKEFRDSLEGKLDSLRSFKNDNDWANYAVLAHSTKSEAKYLGFMKDAEIFYDHELKGKESNASYINDNFNILENTIKKIKTLLDNYFMSSDGEVKNILIADDSSIIRNFIEKNIGGEYRIIKATNGKEAIAKLQEINIYAILLDINMPEVNGFEVLNYLKEKDLMNRIPVVIITGDDAEDTIKRAFSYPILDVLNKPFNDENIRRILGTINSFYDKK